MFLDIKNYQKYVLLKGLENGNSHPFKRGKISIK